jgi:hypothetical protein
MLRVPHCLDNTLTDGGKVVSLKLRPHFTPQKYFFSSSPILICVRGPRFGKFKEEKKNIDLVGTGTRDLAACSTVVNGRACVAGPQVERFMNENWKELYQSMSPGISEAFAQVVRNTVNSVASGLPFDTVFPERTS